MNVMVDLETVDNSPTSGIISIGAVMFDGEKITPNKSFYRAVDMHSSIDYGLTCSKDTMEWWSKQSKEANSVFSDPCKMQLKEALQLFAKYLPEDCKLWGNGAAFDNAILSNAYKAVGIEQPWKFWNDRCYRTLSSLSNIKRVQRGTHHNALDDAKSQAEHLILINKSLRFKEINLL